MPGISRDHADWNDEKVARFRVLWDEGHSTREIGLMLSVSKNAVVGKSHRLDLPSRPSPIKRDGIKRPRVGCRPQTRPIPLPMLPSLQHGETSMPPKRVVLPVLMLVPPAPRPVRYCDWPEGDPGTPGFHFCESTDVPLGRHYCNEHCRIAYIRVKDRREDATV